MAKTQTATPTVIPFVRYADAPAAVDWLCDAFGLERQLVVPGEEGRIAHAELVHQNGMVMLGSTRDDVLGMKTARELGAANQGIYVVIDDADAHFERARAAGAEIVQEPADQDYGSREYICRDPEGNVWSFGTYRPELP
jgi:uncharacterized glyoxalase superfamily protein PhnB